MTDNNLNSNTLLRGWIGRHKKLLARIVISSSFLCMFVLSCFRAEKSGDRTIAIGYGVLFIISLIGLSKWARSDE